MDSPLEACSTYLQHYEPYLKDPVGFPRVMVTAAFLSSPPIVSARSCSLTRFQTSCELNLTAPLSRSLIEKPFFIITAAMSKGPTYLLSHRQIDIRQLCERK